MKNLRCEASLLKFSIFLLVAPSVFAQNAITTGTVRGTVSDETKALLPAATVQMFNPETGFEVVRKTNQRGGYVFTSVPVGTYLLSVETSGFSQVKIDGVIVEVGQATTEDVSMRPGAESQTVRVTATELLRQESSISSVVNQTLLHGLPLNGRRYSDFAQLTPNTSQDGQTGLVSIGGEQGGEDTGYANGNGANSFTLDGADATSSYFGNARGGEKIPFTFGENAIQEFQVTISPYNAAFGGAATGFLNTVTKSGNDNFHGNAFYFNRNSAMGANDAIDKANGLPRPLDILQQFGGAIGGPLLHRKAWVFFDYEQQRHKQPISSINQNFAVDKTAFGLAADTPLPTPDGPLPAPGTDTAPDPANPVYLQQVSNALGALRSNLGSHSRYANDLAVFNKYDWQATDDDRLYLSLNLNHFDSPNGFITATVTPQFGLSALASSFVRDYQASAGWTHIFNADTLSDLHVSFTRDEQYSSPAGIFSPDLPAIVFSAPETFEMGNAGFAGGRTNETEWQVSERIDLVRGTHSLHFGFQTNQSHVTDVSFGGFDPDAARQNGTFGGAYGFSSFPNFALGIYDSYAQSGGNPKFSFDVPYYGFFAQDTWQVSPRLTLDLGLREDFQIYPQPAENPAFPLTGQFPNEFRRFAPRTGFAYKAAESTIIRGGFGQFYENFNGLNYRNSVVSNGLASQQSSAFTILNPTLAPNAQTTSAADGTTYGPTFPFKIANDSSIFAASPNISIVSPTFKFPYILQASLQVETQIAPDTTLSIGTMWTHGVHLISGSAYDLNLKHPSGTTTYVVCNSAHDLPPCGSKQIVLPNLDAGLLQEGLVTANVGQINALITPGINHYNSLFVQLQRRPRRGLELSSSYAFAKNMTSNGVDFNNQFDFSNTRSPYLIDQRHNLSIAAIYQPTTTRGDMPALLYKAISDWRTSTVMHFSSGRPYAPLLDKTTPNAINDTAFNQATSNSALGINGSAPVPGEGINSYYGPWSEQLDLGVARSFHLGERNTITLQAQAFNIINHANYYAQNGGGVNQFQYAPSGSNCGDGQTLNQTCFLIPETGPGGFGTLQSINALHGPRVLQFAFEYQF